MTYYLYCDNDTFNLVVEVPSLRAAVTKVRESQGLRAESGRFQVLEDAQSINLTIQLLVLLL